MSFLTATRSDNEVVEPRVSFDDIPITAIRSKTREKLSLLLNPKKVLRTEDGYDRDWRGLASLADLSQLETTSIANSKDETAKLLDLWFKLNKDKNIVVTLTQLQKCFGVIDRYDVYDDTYLMLAEDAKVFLSNSKSADKENRSSREIIYADPDNNIITEDDLECNEKGLPLRIYDAFVMFDDKDLEFATELIEKCENNGHSLCVKDRFLGGLTFESEAILNLLSKRCNRLIIIVSKAFLKSPMQIFITNFAQALGIEQGQRKIIPCLLEQCELPQMLRYCFRLDYYRNNKLFDFWDKLDKSLRATTNVRSKTLSDNSQRVSIMEIDASPSSLKVNIPTTPGPLYDKEFSYKFTETPTPSDLSERSSKNFLFQKPSPEESKQIWPPPPKLRESSSMHDLSLPNGDSSKPAKISNKFSQSSFYLNEVVADNNALETIKLKRQKWYKKFLPPSKVPKTKMIEELPEIKEKEEKRPWYKIKKKKNKSKQKVALECEG